MRVTYHSISGIGTFEDPYYCTSSKQEAKDCPVCVSRIPALREAMKNAQIVQAWSPIRDLINYPSHYTDGGIETIDFIEAKKLNYNLGNAVKYISRAGKKVQNNGQDVLTETAIIDIEKAIWYLNRELSTLKGK